MGERIDGWDMIAKHLKVGRTLAISWYEHAGLPVRALTRRRVCAWKHELDEWLARLPPYRRSA